MHSNMPSAPSIASSSRSLSPSLSDAPASRRKTAARPAHAAASSPSTIEASVGPSHTNYGATMGTAIGPTDVEPTGVKGERNPDASRTPQAYESPLQPTESTRASTTRMSASGATPIAANGATSSQTLLNALPSSAQMTAQAAVAAMASTSALRANSLSAFDAITSVNNASGALHPAASSSFAFHHQPFQSRSSPHHAQSHISMERFTAELTNCIIAFLSPILPTEEEYRIKEATRRQLERLAGKVSPGAKLLAFGSMANGFALKNSDMDLCLIEAKSDNTDASSLNASELVEALGKILREETDYNVMPLPKARIPIIKISRPPTSELPYDISCDIGFENRLALENTRLLLSYAMVDPPRLRTLVLFLKVWTKRRKLNSPYTGTLSSYGYTLMMIFFLMHVKRPAVLPNLQRIPPSSTSTCKQDASLNGHSIYFYDDVATLRKEWTSQNTENVGELLLDFFKYFSKGFGYARDVISIRSEQGVFAKDNKSWNAELCIEDPFQSGYNVARTVTKDGLYTIRGEFIRASRILTSRMNRVSAALAELCEEREDGLTRAPDPSTYSHRSRHGGAPPTFLNPSLYLPTGGFDPRYLRDLTRRIEAGSQSPSGYGGSFAFEEMARGLAQAQHGGQAVAYPPTTAMLAPLSQNVSLSPQQSLMRAGLRYDTAQRGHSIAAGLPSTYTNLALAHNNNVGSGGSSSSKNASGLPSAAQHSGKMGNASVPSTPRVSSSARSVDGGSSSYGRRKNKRWNANAEHRVATDAAHSTGTSSGNISAQNSPRLDSAVPQSLLHPDAAINHAYGIGEAFAYGSEISFGSQRFHLYPQQASKPQQSRQSGESSARQDKSSKMLSPHSAAFTAEGAARNSRSFSDGLSRSKSLPRHALTVERRSSTPALSDPPSPTSIAANANALNPVSDDNSDTSVRGAPEDGGQTVKSAKRLSSMSHSNALPQRGTNLLNAIHLTSQSASGSPYLTPSPWSFYPPTLHSGTTGDTQASNSYAGTDEEPFALLDDDEDEEGVSLSDGGTMDDLARVSGIESSIGGSDQCAEQGGSDSLSEGQSIVASGYEKQGTKGSMMSESKTGHALPLVSEKRGSISPERTEIATGKEQDVRSWAAAQRKVVDTQQSERVRD